MRTTPYKPLIDQVQNAIHLAFHDIRNRESGSLYDCSTFKVKRTNTIRLVLIDDVHAFGLSFSSRLETVVDENADLDGFRFVLMGIGQNTDADYMLQNVLNQFRLEYVEEMVIHVAMDVHKPRRAIFWKRDVLESKKPGNLTGSYFPLLMKGAGNFYYTRNTAEFGRQPNQQPSIRMIKFYGAALKDVHRLRNPPFQKSCIGNSLWNTMFSDYGGNLELEGFPLGLEVYRNNVKNLVTHRHIQCRAEFIVSTLNPLNDAGRKSVELAKADFFANEYNLESGFKVLKMIEVKDQVELYLEPALKTIELELQKCIDIHYQREADTIYTISVEQYHTIAAAEAIASFFTYGIAVSIRGEKRHNNELCKMIGLQQRDFIRENEEPMFGGFISGLDDGTINFWLPRNFVIQDFFRDQNFTSTLKVSQILKDLDQRWGTPIIKVLSTMFVELMLREIIRSRQYTQIPVERLCKETQKFIRVKKTLTHSAEFVDRILGDKVYNEDYRRKGLKAINNIIRIKLGSVRFTLWKKFVGEELEKLMWSQKTFVVFPLNNQSCLICIPILTLALYENTTVSLGYSRLYYEVCEECFENMDIVSQADLKNVVDQLLQQMKNWSRRQLISMRVHRMFLYLVTCGSQGKNINPIPASLFYRNATIH